MWTQNKRKKLFTNLIVEFGISVSEYIFLITWLFIVIVFLFQQFHDRTFIPAQCKDKKHRVKLKGACVWVWMKVCVLDCEAKERITSYFHSWMFGQNLLSEETTVMDI